MSVKKFISLKNLRDQIFQLYCIYIAYTSACAMKHKKKTEGTTSTAAFMYDWQNIYLSFGPNYVN